MNLAQATKAKAPTARTVEAIYQTLAAGGLTMTDNIIDKSLFFRRMAKPTDEENEARFSYLLDQHLETLQELISGEYTLEQRVRIMTSVLDFADVEIRLKKGGELP